MSFATFIYLWLLLLSYFVFLWGFRILAAYVMAKAAQHVMEEMNKGG